MRKFSLNIFKIAFPATWYNLLGRIKIKPEEAGMGIVNDFNKLLTSIPLNAVLRERINILLEKVRQLEVELMFLRNKTISLESENAVLKSENASLKKQLHDFQLQIEHYKQETKKLKNGILGKDRILKLIICPYCHQPKGRLLKIEPHPTFKEVGVKIGYYECGNCKKQYDREFQF